MIVPSLGMKFAGPEQAVEYPAHLVPEFLKLVSQKNRFTRKNRKKMDM
jgi:hypothetical protein